MTRRDNNRNDSDLVTGSVIVDWLLGFLPTIISPVLFCFGGMIPIVFYFSKRDRYPVLAKGVWAGLVTLGAVIVVAACALGWWGGQRQRQHTLGSTPGSACFKRLAPAVSK